MFKPRYASSAKKQMFKCVTSKDKSFIYYKNASGPSTAPCGTPAKTSPLSEV